MIGFLCYLKLLKQDSTITLQCDVVDNGTLLSDVQDDSACKNLGMICISKLEELPLSICRLNRKVLPLLSFCSNNIRLTLICFFIKKMGKWGYHVYDVQDYQFNLLLEGVKKYGPTFLSNLHRALIMEINLGKKFEVLILTLHVTIQK